MADTIKRQVRDMVKEKLLSLSGKDIKGESLHGVFVDGVSLEVRDVESSVTMLIVRTPAGPRFFEVKFKESWA